MTYSSSKHEKSQKYLHDLHKKSDYVLYAQLTNSILLGLVITIISVLWYPCVSGKREYVLQESAFCYAGNCIFGKERIREGIIHECETCRSAH